MPDINEYIKRLNDLKMRSLDDYNKAMAMYRDTYPSFYAQLVAAMETSSKQASTGKLKDFALTYKWYLLAISIGIGVIIYLLYVLMVR